MSLTGSVMSATGTVAATSFPFQAVNCASLPFHPTFEVFTHAGHNRRDGGFLHVRLIAHGGPGASGEEANIGRVDVQLPKHLVARDSTLKQACTEAQFEANPSGCPAGSFVGHAKVVSPILAKPLEGPAIFVSHGSLRYPDLDLVLQGEGVVITLTGHTFISSRGFTFSRFQSVPDAPISSFNLYLPEGPHSALAANGNLCHTVHIKRKRVAVRKGGRTVYETVKVRTKKPLHMTMPTTITAQNGAVLRQQTKVVVVGCGAHRT
jgi:hypothetical protein